MRVFLGVRPLTLLVGCSVAALFSMPRECVAAATPAEIEAVADLARSAPPELAADAMIRLGNLDETPKKRRVELLEQAFQLAAGSPEPYKRRPALARAQGPSGFLARVYAQDLDALTLRLRAVDGLLPLDPKTARRRFEEIPPLAPPPLTCDDFLVYDVGRFYEVLGRVAAQSFTPKEIKEEDRARFLAGYVGAVSSAVQIDPVAHLLETALLTDAEFPVLVTAFSGALSRISGDDRSAAYGAREAGNSILALAELCQRRQVSPLVVLEAFRTFLVSHLSGVRCEELPGETADPAAFFNDKLRGAVLPPISDSERTAAKTEGKAKGLAWCENPECQAIRDQYHALIFRKEDGEAFPQSERERNEWQAGVRDFLGAMTAWTQDSAGTQAAFFREKIGFYNDLLAVVPNGDTRALVLGSMLAFLGSNRLDGEDRLQWELPVIQVVGRLGLDPNGLGRLAGDVQRARDSVIALETALEFLAPIPVNEFMLLL